MTLRYMEDTEEITIVLAEKKASMIETPEPTLDFKKAFNKPASVIQTRKLPLLVNEYKVWVKSLASCL